MANIGPLQRLVTGETSGVVSAIREAASRTGMDFGALLQTARVESRLNPQAKAATSSASGLFQFIDSTWMSTLKRFGAQHGLNPSTREEAMALRNDPLAASLMAAEHMGENIRHLQSRLGRAVDATDAYLAHFLGIGGAGEFLKKLATTPDAPANSAFPSAAKANKSIFYAEGAARSFREIHQLFARKLGLGGEVSSPPAIQQAPRLAAPPLSLMDEGPAADSATGESLMAALMGDGNERGTADFLQSALPPAAKARIAYLLLAELGG